MLEKLAWEIMKNDLLWDGYDPEEIERIAETNFYTNGEIYISHVLKMLQVLEEPTGAMVDAGQEWVDWCGRHDETPEPKSGWRNMISAAREEE